MSIYGDIILDHYQNPRNNVRLDPPKNTVHVNNPLCGDELDFDIKIEKGRIKAIGFAGQGCAIAVASASLLSEFAKDKKIEVIKKLRPETVLKLLGVELSPNRMKCGLLAWEALKKVVEQ